MIELSGVVVSYNEAIRLERCLESLYFCSEIIVVDLGSEDESVEIAAKCGAIVVEHQRVPVVEKVLAKAISYAKNSWIVLLDPDEIFPVQRLGEVMEIITSYRDVGMITVPRRFYIKDKPIFTTAWGKCSPANRIINKERVEIRPLVHAGIVTKQEFRVVNLEYRGETSVIRHYWVDSYSQMFEKHIRYLKYEGEARYIRGERFSWIGWFKGTLDAGWFSLIKCDGVRGGIQGVLLSIFYMVYVSLGLISLRSYQKKQGD